jgi:outer membrane protein assembly factor BamB
MMRAVTEEWKSVSMAGWLLGVMVTFSFTGCQSVSKLSGGEGGGGVSSLTALPSSAVVVAEGSRVVSYQPDGAVGWSFTLPEDEEVAAAPVAALSSVTYVRGEQTLFAIAPDGVALWQSRHTGAGDTIKGITPLGDSTVAITQDDRSLVAFTDRGQVRWTFSLPEDERIVAPPALTASSVVYLRSGRHLYAIDPTGNLAWKVEAGR